MLGVKCIVVKKVMLGVTCTEGEGNVRSEMCCRSG